MHLASHDKTVQLWDTQTGGALQHTLKGHSETVSAMVFTPDGQVVASIAKDAVRLWDAPTGALQRSHHCSSKLVNSNVDKPFPKIGAIAFLTDGRLFAYATLDYTVQLKDIATGTLQQTIGGGSESIYAVKISPDG